MRSLFGISTGLLLSGTALAVVLAYTIPFLAASLGAVESGLSSIPANIDAAARTLGSSVSELLVKVHIPMLRPALGAAALLIFVEFVRAHDRACEPRPSPPAARHPKPAGSLGEPFCPTEEGVEWALRAAR